MEAKQVISEYLKNTDDTVKNSKILSDKVYSINTILSEKLDENLDILSLTQLEDILNKKNIKEQKLGSLERLITKNKAMKEADKRYKRRFIECNNKMIVVNTKQYYSTTYDNSILSSSNIKNGEIPNSEYSTLYESRDNFSLGFVFKNKKNDIFAFKNTDVVGIDINTGTLSDTNITFDYPVEITDSYVLSKDKKLDFETLTISSISITLSGECNDLTLDKVMQLSGNDTLIYDIKSDSVEKISNIDGNVIHTKDRILQVVSIGGGNYNIINVKNKEIINSFHTNSAYQVKKEYIRSIIQSDNIALIATGTSGGSSYYTRAIICYFINENRCVEYFDEKHEIGANNKTFGGELEISKAQGSFFITSNLSGVSSVTPEYRIRTK